MKKGKVLGKSQIVAVVMVMVLGAAVWLNMKFTSNEKYLGQAQLVSSKKSDPAVTETAASVKAEDYFSKAKSERDDALKEAQELTEETLKGANITDAERDAALKMAGDFAKRVELAQKVETLLKAKDFPDAVAVVGEDNISIVVKSDGLTTPQTLQIQDVAVSMTKFALDKIKIVAIKE